MEKEKEGRVEGGKGLTDILHCECSSSSEQQNAALYYSEDPSPLALGFFKIRALVLCIVMSNLF